MSALRITIVAGRGTGRWLRCCGTRRAVRLAIGHGLNCLWLSVARRRRARLFSAPLAQCVCFEESLSAAVVNAIVFAPINSVQVEAEASLCYGFVEKGSKFELILRTYTVIAVVGILKLTVIYSTLFLGEFTQAFSKDILPIGRQGV